MDYLLDTSVLIDLLRDKGLTEKFISAHIDETISTSAVCEAELNEGIYREKEENIPKRLEEKVELFESLSKVISFDSDQADIAGKIRASLAIKGSPIGDLDVLIAAAAISQSATLVTKDVRHFQRIEGLEVMEI